MTGSIQNLMQFKARDYIKIPENSGYDYFTGKGVTVAVLDTGIYSHHETVTNDGKNSWKRKIIEFYDDRINGTASPYDISWHGTWTASILGGKCSNYDGVAPNVNLVILKIFENENGEVVSDFEKLNNAVNWILANKDKYNIKVASMSFGIEYNSDYESLLDQINDAIEKLVQNDILVVAAAGNYGNQPDQGKIGTVSSPGSAKSALTVGGIVNENTMYQLSGKGPTHEGAMKPDTCAPAQNIYGATSSTTSSYARYSGTSGSTPMVAGLAALMLEKVPNLSALAMKNIISFTSYKTIDPLIIRDNNQGWGIVQGYAALDALNIPINMTFTTRIDFSLGKEKNVLCIPINLIPNHYFFKLEELNTADAEMYLFDTQPDKYGNPILIANSINEFTTHSNLKTMGFYSQQAKNYYLLIKLIPDTGLGDFSLSISFDARLSVLFILVACNVGGLIYILRRHHSTLVRKVN